MKSYFEISYSTVIKIIDKNLKKEDLSLTKEINIIRTSPPLDKKRELENVIHDLGIHDIGIFDHLYNLENSSLIDKSLVEKNGMICEADITFLSKDIKINLKLSNIAEEKIDLGRLLVTIFHTILIY